MNKYAAGHGYHRVLIWAVWLMVVLAASGHQPRDTTASRPGAGRGHPYGAVALVLVLNRLILRFRGGLRVSTPEQERLLTGWSGPAGEQALGNRPGPVDGSRTAGRALPAGHQRLVSLRPAFLNHEERKGFL